MEFTTAFGRLLSEAALRQLFAEEPREAADRLSFHEEDPETFLTLDCVDLEAQAATLINKRFHEVAGLVY